MVRVCNLCLEKLAKVEDEDDDDRRSVVSSTTSPFPAHQFGGDTFALRLGRHPQSPFAASQLFGRTNEPFNLYSIVEDESREDANMFYVSAVSAPLFLLVSVNFIADRSFPFLTFSDAAIFDMRHLHKWNLMS
ncbi:hypothetical protein AZE42_04204, partial [Rhizopogon vesiculosus]